ncbi:MAG: hypothetical protein IPN79_10805 [Saprospiraceae bacterium]|nr:hypothetical protein [Saprospiraceae bacterium]
MKLHVLITFIFTTFFFTANSQSVDIIGQLKVSDVPLNNTASDIIVRNTNGTLEKRDAATLGSIPSTAIVLSETEINTNLINAGFTNTGAMSFNFFAIPTSTNYGEWDFMNSDNLPPSRTNHSAIWTGTHVIFWGGIEPSTGNYLNTGYKYDPVTDTWTTIATTNAPSGRINHTAIWTGTEMIIWGGQLTTNTYTNTGHKYNPVSDTWTAINTSNAPVARTLHSGVWTGSELIVWGGYTGTYTNSGGKYNPVTDTWTPTSNASAPLGRSNPTAVWTGTEVIVWGGYLGSATGSGGRYNPVTDTWSPTEVSFAPFGRTGHVAVWSGTEMLVWGGYNGASTYYNEGGKYNPVTNTWTTIPFATAPEGRYYPQVAWTGTEMIVWGGGRNSGTLYYNTGGKYNPTTNTWLATTLINVPAARRDFAGCWTGTKWVIWGGSSNFAGINSGAFYDPALPGYAPATTALRFLYKKN